MRLKYSIFLLSISVVLSGCRSLDLSGGKIIFSTEGKLMEIDPEGKNQKVIGNLPSPMGAGCISSDGKKICYDTRDIKEGSGWAVKIKESKIFVSDIDGKNQIKLTEGYPDIVPSFSPDNKKIAFSSKRDEGEDYEIYVMDIEEREMRKLTDNSLDDFSPKWSPDGKKIVFSSTIVVEIPKDFAYNPEDKNTPLDKRDNSSEIYIVDIDKNNIIRLTNNSVCDDEPTFSPDGKRIAYISEGELCIMDVDGKNVINLTKGNPYLIKITGGGKNKFIEGKNYGILNPRWSPDSQYISFLLIGLINGKDELNIYIISLDSKEIKRVTNLLSSIYNLAWLPASLLDK